MRLVTSPCGPRGRTSSRSASRHDEPRGEALGSESAGHLSLSLNTPARDTEPRNRADTRTLGRQAAQPVGITIHDLKDAIRHAVTVTTFTTFTTQPHPDQPTGWPIRWGDPDKALDIQTITLTGHGEVTDSKVAGYLAKYATKSTEATGHTSARITANTINTIADPDGDHTSRLIDACWRLGRPTTTPTPLSQRPRSVRPTNRSRDPWICPACGTFTWLTACPACTEPCQPNLDTKPDNKAEPNPYAGLRRWAHMLGFGGHFLTKARRYSVTFAHLRDTRIRYRRDEDQTDPPTGVIRTADHTEAETILVVGVLSYAGTGWHTTGDALLANTSADLARSRRQAGKEELDHEIGSAFSAALAA